MERNQIYFSHMPCKEKNGMPVGSSVELTLELLGDEVLPGFTVPMPCWLCQRNKALTALPSHLQSCICRGEPQRMREHFTSGRRGSSPAAPNLQESPSSSCPLLQPNPLPVQLTSGSPHHPVGLGCLGKPSKVCQHSELPLLPVNNEVSHF